MLISVLLGEMLSFSDLFGAFLIIIGCMIDEINMGKFLSNFLNQQKKAGNPSTLKSLVAKSGGKDIDESEHNV